MRLDTSLCLRILLLYVGVHNPACVDRLSNRNGIKIYNYLHKDALVFMIDYLFKIINTIDLLWGGYCSTDCQSARHAEQFTSSIITG